MPTFQYKAKDRAGNTVTGTVMADDEHGAASIVREMGYLPMEFRIAHESRKSQPSAEAGSIFTRYFIYPLWTGINIKILALFYRQLATLLGSGLSLSEALRSIERRTRGRLGVIIAETKDNVSNGGRMSETLIRYPRVFSRLQIALIRAGESGGLLEQMVDRIASYLEYEIKIRNLIVKAAIYPIVILVFAVLVWICVPNLEILVNDGFSPFFVKIWPQLSTLVFGLILLVVFAKLIFQFNTVKLIWDCIKVQFPVVGTNARKIAMSRFSRALSILYAAGMSIDTSVDIAADAGGNLHIGRKIKYAIPSIQTGMGLTEALTRTGAITPMVLDMLAVGERAGGMDATLQKTADYMDEEVDVSIHKIGIAIFVLILLIAGVVVGYLVITFFMKVYGGLSAGIKS